MWLLLFYTFLLHVFVCICCFGHVFQTLNRAVVMTLPRVNRLWMRSFNFLSSICSSWHKPELYCSCWLTSLNSLNAMLLPQGRKPVEHTAAVIVCCPTSLSAWMPLCTWPSCSWRCLSLDAADATGRKTVLNFLSLTWELPSVIWRRAEFKWQLDKNSHWNLLVFSVLSITLHVRNT